MRPSPPKPPPPRRPAPPTASWSSPTTPAAPVPPPKSSALSTDTTRNEEFIVASSFLIPDSSFLIPHSSFLIPERCVIIISNMTESNLRILAVDDDPRILDLLRRGLVYEGYHVDTAVDGPSALATARDNPPDLVVLDWMMPGLDGLEVCRRLRAAGDVPILMLTAKDDIKDRVTGLDAGADDYLVKPFSVDELMARVRALFRRSTPTSKPEILRFADLSLDTGTHRAYRGERPIDLTAKEYELLELFMRNPRQVLTRDLIFDRVWNYDFGGESNIIEVYVRYLRQKTESEGEPRLLHTVRGVGYVLREQ